MTEERSKQKQPEALAGARSMSSTMLTKEAQHKQKRAVGLCLLLVVATFLPVLAVAIISDSMLRLRDRHLSSGTQA